MIYDGFIPRPDRGVSLDAHRHMDLASSLAHLAQSAAEVAPQTSERLTALAVAIQHGKRVRPLAFRIYFRLVPALISGNTKEASSLLTKFETLLDRAEARQVTYFGAPDGDQLSLELIEDGMRLAPITETEAADFKRLLDDGWNLMAEGLPDLHLEIAGLVHEVLLARAPHGDDTEFDGASHYQFWGLLLLNPRHHRSPLSVVEVLAHEASHSLLFGLTVDEPLVFNPDDELFPSPLRLDQRPMDGIFHAAYVSARMCWAMEQLARSERLSPDDRHRAAEAARQDRTNWERGLAVIEAHGKLSRTGDRILQAARAAMKER